jgi:mRNA-degrading endonuclease toxin of MazEF toxin-antitoxin module
MAALLRGEIRTAAITPAVGVPGPSGHCQVLILSSDNFNHRSDSVIVLPVDYSQDNFDMFDSMQIHTANGIRSPVWVLLDQIRTLSDDRIGERVASVGLDEVLAIQKAFWQRLF